MMPMVCLCKRIVPHPSHLVASICLPLSASRFSFSFETWMVVLHKKVCAKLAAWRDDKPFSSPCNCHNSIFSSANVKAQLCSSFKGHCLTSLALVSCALTFLQVTDPVMFRHARIMMEM
ncbi:hypothetical protein PanWU01x14_274190 [Parasponia andersonii]|uniref:Uncharacterized protein n=1 Tax=Parasponia andersonii TaxID=3476 RepID=A0A2P5B3R2_PARAD|nr:hypothetical protein PanWU01x14_274190 [Parasponia andersonii]